MNPIILKYLGRKDFRSVWDYQRSLLEDRRNNKTPDTLLLVEHDPVYTAGKNFNNKNISNMDSEGNLSGIPLVNIDRGGDITFHGPGQLVGYPIIFLGHYYLDLHKYLRDLEEVIIMTLSDYNIEAQREEGLTGVWVDGEKIASIGVKVSRWYTMHGFALNINTDLSYYEKIVACGIKDRNMTSMSKILGKEVDFMNVAESTGENFKIFFTQRQKERSE
ncbi:MAG: lipoyl(octanoyl) transferase LipB [bacterium]|nr:lipoyl(octanoyl) transferase LipB [bacterium]